MAPLPQLHPGIVFARDFRVLSLLAHGGMGSLYVVEQLSTGKRRALKIMQPQLVADPRARQRFELEARIGGRIGSEHVVEVVGAGVDEATGTPWLAMELLEGQDLSSSVRARGHVPAAELHEVFLQLGDGLGAAHKQGIVHRDLKPENLFIAVSRRRGIPFTLKILDFGIAKITQESKSSDRQTVAMGTPLWMAPEQTEQGELTPATDVWALGLIAFNALTGRLYWRAANQEEVRLTALFTELLVAPLDPPSVRAAQLGAPVALPAGFDHWFLRCVARDRTLRFPDGAAAVAALGAGFTFEQAARGHAVAPTQAARAVAPTAMLDSADAPPAAGGGPRGGHSAAGGGYTPQPLQTPGGYTPHGPGGAYAAQPQHPGSGGYAPQAGGPGGGYTPQPPQHASAGYTPQPHGPGGGYTPQPHAGPGQAYPQPPHTTGSATGGVGYATPHGATPGGYTPGTPYTATGPMPSARGGSAMRLVLAIAGLAAVTVCAAGGSYGAFAGYEAYMAGRGGPPPPPPSAADAGTTVAAVPPDAGVGLAMAPLEVDAGSDAGPALALAAGGTTEAATAAADPEPDPEPSDAPYRWGDGEVRRLRGTARWSNGLVADFVLTLNRNGGNLAGFFDWTVREAPPGSPNHPGQHINEGVYGTFAAPALTLHSNAAGTTFNFRLSGAGRLSGRDSEGGRFSGRVAR